MAHDLPILNMAIVHTCVSLPEAIFERTCPVGLGRDGIQLETDSTVTRQKALHVDILIHILCPTCTVYIYIYTDCTFIFIIHMNIYIICNTYVYIYNTYVYKNIYKLYIYIYIYTYK